MSLPKVFAPIESVEVGGERFEVRVLTRAEHFRMQKLSTSGAPEDVMEIELIAMATDTPVDETREWYGATPTWAVKLLVTAITRLSHLDEEAQKSG